MSMNITRYTGLASGMDIESIVKQLMQAERIPMDKLEQDKQLLEWKQEKYREMNSKILDFRNVAFDMSLQSKYLSRKASSEDEAAVSVSAAPGTVDGNYTIKIDQLAKSAQLTSSTAVGAGDRKAALSTIGLTGSTTLAISGVKGTVKIDVAGEDTIEAVISKINSVSKYTGVMANYDENLDHFFFSTSVTGEESKIKLISEHATLLSNVFKLDSEESTIKGSTIVASAEFGTENLIGTASFSSRTDPINDELSSDQIIRITRNGQNYDFTITNTTKIEDIAKYINESGLNEQGVRASLTSDGKLSLFNPSKDKPITFTNIGTIASGDADVLVTLGYKASNGDSAYVAETGNLNSAIINGSLTSTQQLRITTHAGEEYDFAISSKTTLGDLVNSINSSGLGKQGITAYYKNGSLALFNPNDGQPLQFENNLPPAADSTDQDVLVTLGLLTDGGDPDTTITNGITYQEMQEKGQDAKIFYNGIPGSYETNSFTINGLTFTAKKAESVDLNVSVSGDVDAIYESVKEFIEKYNEMIDTVNEALTEKKYRDFLPLTELQKSDLEEQEIKLWEEKAKSGLLRNDSILANGITKFRSALYSKVGGLGEGVLDQLASIGITTGDYTERGKLYISEDKLREAIALNPDEVSSLFTADDDDNTSSSGDGIARRMLDLSDSLLDGLKLKAGTDTTVDSNTQIGRELDELEDRMLAFSERLIQIENRYYRQFTAMETYINQLNQQSAYIAQNFGGNA